MKTYTQLLTLIFAFALMTTIYSCDTTSEQDRSNINTTSPENTGSNNNNDMNSGASGGTGTSQDTSRGSVYEPGPTKDDFDVDYDDNKTTRDYNENSKSNGVREPNEYPSGRTGGQYANPKSTTTPSGTNSKENPATGTPSHTGDGL